MSYRDPATAECPDGGTHVRNVDIHVDSLSMHLSVVPPPKASYGTLVTSVCSKCRVLYVERISWEEQNARSDEDSRRWEEYWQEQKLNLPTTGGSP